MRRHHLVPFLALLFAATVAAGCATGGGRGLAAERGQVGLRSLGEGTYLLDPAGVDALLELNNYPDLRVLVLSGTPPETISDSHMALLEEWVKRGGVLWVEGEWVESPVLNRIAPVRADRFRYRKTATGDRGGELVVRDTTERLRIGDHPLTDGVDQLFIYPAYRFDGTPGAVPIVEMTDFEGNHGVVIAAIEGGDGLVVLDGTAREERLFGGYAGFDPDYPNAVKQGGRWNDYDWDLLLENARRMADLKLS